MFISYLSVYKHVRRLRTIIIITTFRFLRTLALLYKTFTRNLGCVVELLNRAGIRRYCTKHTQEKKIKKEKVSGGKKGNCEGDMQNSGPRGQRRSQFLRKLGWILKTGTEALPKNTSPGAVCW